MDAAGGQTLWNRDLRHLSCDQIIEVGIFLEKKRFNIASRAHKKWDQTNFTANANFTRSHLTILQKKTSENWIFKIYTALATKKNSKIFVKNYTTSADFIARRNEQRMPAIEKVHWGDVKMAKLRILEEEARLLYFQGILVLTNLNRKRRRWFAKKINSETEHLKQWNRPVIRAGQQDWFGWMKFHYVDASLKNGNSINIFIAKQKIRITFIT